MALVVHADDAAFAKLFRFENTIRAVATTTTATQTMKMRRPTTDASAHSVYSPSEAQYASTPGCGLWECDLDDRTRDFPDFVDVPSDIGEAALVLQDFIDVPSDIG